MNEPVYYYAPKLGAHHCVLIGTHSYSVYTNRDKSLNVSMYDLTQDVLGDFRRRHREGEHTLYELSKEAFIKSLMAEMRFNG